MLNVNYEKWPDFAICRFNEIKPALNQKHARNVCHTAHKYLTEFHFDST